MQHVGAKVVAVVINLYMGKSLWAELTKYFNCSTTVIETSITISLVVVIVITTANPTLVILILWAVCYALPIFKIIHIQL